jgi:glycerate-2-kinase
MSEGDRIIKNFDTLATTGARHDLLTVVEAGLHAIQTPQVIRNAVHIDGDTLTLAGSGYDVRTYEHFYVLAVGKCSLDAVSTLEDILGERITDGVSIDVRPAPAMRRVRCYEGTHPFPSTHNIEHTAQLLALAEQATERDLVLVIISGGGSALLTQPATHTAVEEATLIEHLFARGATIEHLNTVRKHLSRARGGHLAAAAHPATVVTLLFSDVPGNDIRTIASGPTVRDESTVADARALFETYHVSRCGFSAEHLFETPKAERFFTQVRNELVLTNETALIAMRDEAQRLGYTALIRDTMLRGEARDVGAMIAEELRTVRSRTALLYGGETTVTIKGTGKGGRNEELTLGALPHLDDTSLVLSIASDGRDNSDYAGGVSDVVTRKLAEERECSVQKYLDANDSFSFFHTLQQGVTIGYTGANVADLVVGLKSDIPA